MAKAKVLAVDESSGAEMDLVVLAIDKEHWARLTEAAAKKGMTVTEALDSLLETQKVEEAVSTGPILLTE